MIEQLRILILEDNPGDARLMALALEDYGLEFSWQHASDRASFLAALEPVPDLILADYHLPGYGALEALEQIRAQGLDQPFIIITGLSRAPEALETIRLGATDYLRKDDLERLPYAVDRALEEKRFRDRHTALLCSFRDQEEKFREFVEGTDDLVVQTDARGIFLFANPAARRYLGLPPEECLGRSAFDFVHPEDRERTREAFGSWIARKKRHIRFANRVVGSGHQVFYLSWTINAHYNDQGDFLFMNGIAQDITDQKIVQEQLQNTLENQRSLLEASPAAIFTVAPDGRIMTWNSSAERVFGWPAQEIIGRPAPFVPPEFEREFHEHLKQLLKGEKILEKEVCRQTRDGRRIPISLSAAPLHDGKGKAVGVVAVIFDITRRKAAEEELLRANRTLRVVSLCNEALVRAVSEQELMQKILTQMVETGGYPVALTWLSGEEEGDFQPVVYPEKAAGLLTGSEQRSCGIVRHLARVCRQPFSREITLTDEVLCNDSCCRELTEVFGLRSAFSLALDVQGEHLGCLVLFSSAEGFHSEEIYLLKELADDLAFGIGSLRTQAAHREAQELLRLRNRAIEASVNGVMISENRFPDLPLIYVNEAFQRITGYAAEEMLGRDPRFLAGQDQEQKALADIRAALRAGRRERALVRNYRKDGSLFWNDFSVAPVRNEAGEVTHFVSILNDVTERMAYEEELAKKSNYDELTGLANRNLLHDRIEQAIAHARRTGETLALCLLDLDRFQVINDSLGHSLGNELLKRVAERLAAVVRAQDTLARLGGDEFVVLFQDVQDREGLVTVVEKIRDALKPPFHFGRRTLEITASIGISLFPGDGESGDVLIRNADLAMYQAKEEERGTFRYFTPELDVRVVETMDLEADLRRALERNELLLHFQPKVEVASGRIVGCEALVRWQHPERGMVSPGAFIPLAEETGLIEPLGAWVLREACRTNRAFQERGLPPLPVAVNISARQFRNERLVEMVEGILEECGLEPRWLCLELTESMVMEKPEQAAETMFRLKQLGLGLSLDDFGTGYSSLNYLRRFPVDRLKIDRTFISEVAADPGAAAVAESVVAIAHNLEIEAVAEGVETEEQLAFLRGCGCDLYQGFLFSRPVPAEEYTALLKKT